MEFTCSRCGENYDEVFFTRNHDSRLHTCNRRRVCIGCEQKERDSRKCRDRWLAKARDSANRHADKYINLGLVDSRLDFFKKFGWEINRIAHDMKHAYENGCCYCDELFKSMINGPSDLTVDIVDPDKEPYYKTNVKFPCTTCNREKGQTPPHLWAKKLICWAKWRLRQAYLSRTFGRYDGPLFEWNKPD